MCKTGLKLGAIVLAGGAIAALAYVGATRAADSIPDFMQGGMGWASAGGMEPVAGSPPLVAQDPKVHYTANNTGRQADGT